MRWIKGWNTTLFNRDEKDVEASYTKVGGCEGSQAHLKCKQ